MKNILKNIQLIPFVALILFTSCSKDDDGSIIEPTVEELVTSDRWYYESQSNLPLNNCDKQSSLRFFTNGNYLQEVYDEAEGECEMALSGAGTFELISDETLTMTYNENTLIFNIVSISETELVLSLVADEPVILIL